jgi:hypothetical protein
MHDRARNKLAFAVRQMNRRLAEVERRLGIESPRDPMADPDTDRPPGETKETTRGTDHRR